MKYIPLNTYSGYSFFKSALKIEDYIKEAKKEILNILGLAILKICTHILILINYAYKMI